jgi:hypothetical protein
MPPLEDSKENAPPPQQTAIGGAPPENHTVCRFLIKNLQGGEGHAKAEYRIDLVTSTHGLLDIVLKVFEVLQKERLTTDIYSSHLWSLTLAGTKFENGWRMLHHSGPGPGWKMNHLDEEDIRLLKDLAKPLSEGQKGRFSGASVKFDIVVEKAFVASIDPTKVKAYPKLTAVEHHVSSKLDADWLSNQQQEDCALKRAAWADYYQGDNVWKRDRRTREMVPGKPEHGRWGPDELEIMGLLMKAGCKFKKSWKNILEFALVDRAETSASGQWYKLQKESYCLDYIGRNKSNEERILLAKRLAKSRMETFLETAVPKLEPHPWEKTEMVLRKRGLIDDTMCPAAKKQKIRMYHLDVTEGLFDDDDDDSQLIIGPNEVV